MNSSPAMETGGPIRPSTRKSPFALHRRAVASRHGADDGPGTTPRRPRSSSPQSSPASRGRNGKLLRPARVPATDGDRDGRCDRRRVGCRWQGQPGRVSPSPHSRRPSSRARGGGGAARLRRGADAMGDAARPPRPPLDAHLGCARVGGLPTGDGRGRRSPCPRGGGAPSRGEACRCPRATRSSRPRGALKVPMTLMVNGVDYPLELEPATTLLSRCATGRADRREGRLRRLGVRRLHDASRRQARELVLLPCSPGGGERSDDGRRPRRWYGPRPRCRRPSSSRAGCNAGSARPAC